MDKSNTAYLVKNNQVICTINTSIKSGTLVSYSSDLTKEAINGNFQYRLVNPKRAKITRAKMYDRKASKNQNFGKEINSMEFYIKPIDKDLTN